MVNDPEVTTDGAPVLQWFIDEDDYENLVENPDDFELSFSVVLAYDGAVFDNTLAKVRGGGSRFRQKLGMGFDLPKGYKVNIPEILPYPIDEFALVEEWGGRSRGFASTGWWLYEQAGFPTVHTAFVRLERNGNFDAVYLFQEKMDGGWRDVNNLDSGSLYKAKAGGLGVLGGVENKSGEAHPAALAEIRRRLLSEPSEVKADFIYDWFDVPDIVNYLAASSIVGHIDSAAHNFYVYQDGSPPNLWSLYPWDLNLTFGTKFRFCPGDQTDLSCVANPLYDSIYEIPELDEMVWARISTLLANALESDRIEAMQIERVESIGLETAELERIAWPDGRSYDGPLDRFSDQIDGVRANFAVEPRVPELGDPTLIEVLELDADPQDGGPEVLILFNSGSAPVDLSGWRIDAVFNKEKTIPGGTVILGGAQLVLTDSIAGLRAKYPEMPNFVVVQYNGGLKRDGELLEFATESGEVVVSYDYSEDVRNNSGSEVIIQALGAVNEDAIFFDPSEDASAEDDEDVSGTGDESEGVVADSTGQSAGSSSSTRSTATTIALIGVLALCLISIPIVVLIRTRNEGDLHRGRWRSRR